MEDDFEELTDKFAEQLANTFAEYLEKLAALEPLERADVFRECARLIRALDSSSKIEVKSNA